MNLANKEIFFFRITFYPKIKFCFPNMAELDRVDVAAHNSSFKTISGLINAARDEGLFPNHQKMGKPYSASRIYGMLKEEMSWVADKLVRLAEENPRKVTVQ